MRQFWTSLRFRLMLLVIFASVPAFLLILYSGWQGRQQAAREAQEKALGLAKVASMQHQHIIDETHRLLLGLAQIPAVRDGDAERCTPLLASLQQSYRIYTNLTVNDTNGELVCSAVPATAPGATTSSNDRKWFQRAMATKEFAYGDYVIGRISGKAALLTGLPILDDAGNVKFLVHAGVDLTWVNDFGASMELPQGSRIAVADRQGRVLIRYPNPQQWVGRNLTDSGLVTPRIVRGEREGLGEGVGAEGVRRIYGFTVLGSDSAPEDEVAVSVALPSAVAYAEADRRLERNLIGLGIVVFLALLAAWVGSDLFLLRRLKDLVTASRRVASGDLGARSGIGGDRSELGELGRAFDDMAAALQERSAEQERAEAERTLLLRTKDSVISTVSHELRTPLSSIRSYSEMLLQYDDPAVRREFLEIINAESERLTRLLNEVLDLTTIESGKVVWNVSAFELGPLIEDSIRLYAPLARQHELAITADIESRLPKVSTDADRLRQVLNNLLDNAIKFTDHGTISVSARRAGDEVRLAVADTGVGVAPDDLERIFERFHQAETAASGKPRGVGLGLSICREIVQRSGGRIWAESTPGKGSTFIVALPALESGTSTHDTQQLTPAVSGR